MKTNLQNKYKDRTPEETILIIKDFFSKKGFYVYERNIQNPMPNIWWCNLTLKYGDINIQNANGKGTSEMFALASGYAELYERYCQFQNDIFSAKLNQNKFFELNYNKNGYYFYSDEIFLSPEEAINISPRISDYCNSINDNRNSLLKYYQSNYLKGILSLPFEGFNINSKITLPLNLLYQLTGSSGSAAGNTLEEALVQGCSELCEHYVENLIYYESKPFKKINLDKINYNDSVKEYFKKLKENNYSYSLFDFSYLYNVPVLGLYIIDLEKKVAFLNLGSSPIFDIALERCCAEIYQGQQVLGDNIKYTMYAPRELISHLVLAENISTLTFSNCYPDNLLLDFEIVDDFNKEIFLETIEYTNSELNKYYKNLFNLLKWEVYYRDFSQISSIKSIKIYVNNIHIKSAAIIEKNKTIPTLIKKRKWDILFKWNQIIEDYFNTKTLNQNLIKEYIELRNKDDINYSFITEENFMKLELFSIFGLNKNIEINFDILYNSLVTKNSYGNFLNFSFDNEDKQYYSLFKYSILFNYKDKYSIEEIKKIANSFNIEYNEIDLLNKNNLLYYLDQLYFSFYYNYYNSEEYEKILTLFMS